MSKELVERHKGFTPGPWERCADASQDDFRDYIVGCDHTIVCDISGMGPQSDADARLIAAAPDLLDALREVERLRLATDEGTCAQRFDRAWQAAVAAIAKATQP